ncbi:BZ3500_MvSof-1268-A1-R1_Chr2-2g05002 [Microbotryum saponariae]|uniref:BZ3500_MvSof-1268-A1-R1_Chr2-2g05002 protein n=1 Tax=Microbotryum saponariae TaxID=289078 RepID=A0A2X0L2A3_9BASI|nr:BZ3500_MvSof-1268-A1-R1_Chr2-2g05002 [Microbotryum saponariae]SDA00681.1 BZ3501_MvSof-1269-A2-R1_Chr2-2g04676 [Microbotryum saponariae]
MDQSAFRALLSSSNKPSGTSSGKAASTPRFGAPPPKRSAAATAPALHESVDHTDYSSTEKPLTPLSRSPDHSPTASTSSTEFKPRNQKDKSKYKHKQAEADEAKSSSASAYRDRAAERRTGARHDFADAEKLLEDFKARVGVDDGLTKDELEEQMKYLGGDAEHTVLVKGLDMALLERMKAQQAAGADQSLEDVEDELDLVLADKAKKAEEKKKRTRDDLIAELKASKGGSKSDRPAAGGQSVKDPRFKPVGFKPIGHDSETEPKKKKKKKKVKVAEQVATAGDAAASASEVSKPLPIPPPTIDVEADDDLDIFGDAGEYKGLDTDSDDNDNHEATAARKEPTFEQTAAPPGNATAAVKRSYFDDEEEDEDVERSTAPDSVTNLASSKQPAVKMTDSNAIMGEGEEEEEQRPMRLQPLSKSAIPNVKELLAMDAAAEKEEKRKERKQHYQMKAADKKEATLKAMTSQQRAEHEHQVMMTYLEKKERRAKGESTKEDEEDDDVANGGF